uniref:Secreted protein n=1 Tax=Anisakis simplex TaxID=6269 RepID=A0A0M3JC71_ANISI
LRSLMDVTCSFLRKSITYPFALTSILMSTFGSSLPVRDLNVRSSSIWSLRSTKCSSWWQVHQLLWSSGNQWRGQYSFFRLYRGALQLGWDGLYYAAPILSL